MPRLEVAADGFRFDDRPLRIISGGLHYFRIHLEQWADRLRKARLVGLNTIETYVPWNVHSPHPGEFRLDAGLDLPRLLDLPFAFGLPADAEGVTAALGENPPQRLTDVMHSAWVAFVTDLDPGAGWPRYTTSQRSTMIWDAEPHAESDPLGPVREIWLG
ncbi:beta-galactosidase [Streptomyces sp. NPDC127118]|uniref:beta-galactosidase n=1 Tax=Streptomyces sp. NPDC127118 TaxID=3345369 RepID=UPI0036387645